MPEQIENLMVNDAAWRPIYKPFCRCMECGGDIYEGNYYFDFDGDIVCEDCEPDYTRNYVRNNFRRCAG